MTRAIYGHIETLIITAAALLMMVSCTTDDGEYISNDIELMTFAQPVMKGTSRAYTPHYGDLVHPYLTSEQMVVYGKKYKGAYQGDNAWQTAETEFADAGEVAIYSSQYDGWATDKKHYWKKDYNYTFNAYSPADPTLMSKVTCGENGITITDFTPGNLGSQYDLLYTNRTYDITRTNMLPGNTDPNNRQYAGVPLVFNHALSSIHIKICVDPAFVQAESIPVGKYKVNKIWITGVDEIATFNQNITPKKTYKGQDSNGQEIWIWEYHETPGWTGTEDNKNRQYVFLNSEQNIPTVSGGDTEAALQDITELGGQMALLIPQNLTNVKLHIRWTNDGNSAKPSYVKKDYNLSTYGAAWLMGHKYTYKLTFTGNKIYFAPCVENLAEGDTKEI